MNQTEKKILLPVMHILLWVVVFVVPILIFASEGKPILETLERSTMQLPFFMILFYINYCWLIENFFVQKEGFAVCSYQLVFDFIGFESKI